MSKLKDLFKSSKSASKDKPNGEVGGVPETQGLDAKRMAEVKAEEAGAKWRARAEKSGEIEKETGGPKGLEPTRYGDWEKAGRCSDF